MTIPRANILGVGVSAINLEIALRTIKGWISRQEHHYVCVTGVHGVMKAGVMRICSESTTPLVWSYMMGCR